MNKENILLEALNTYGNFTTVSQEFSDNQLQVIYEAMELVKNNAVLPLVSDTGCPKCKGQSNSYIHGFRTYCDRCGGTGQAGR